MYPFLLSSPVAIFIFTFLSISATVASTHTKYCPPLGPAFPLPTNLSSSAAIAAARANITQTLEAYIQAGLRKSPAIFDANETSFTLQVFSVNDPEPLHGYYYTAPALSLQGSNISQWGVHPDTVFRIGSVSKIWTVLLYLIEAGDGSFNDPVVKYIPELRRQENATDMQNSIDFVRWEEVTIGELAGQMAGVGRDYAFSDLSLAGSSTRLAGLPHLTQAEIPPCGGGGLPPCDRAQFFHGFLAHHPVVPTSSTPIYSNAAFQILGYVLEAITDQNYSSLLVKDIIQPLNLTRSSYTPPDSQFGIIPVNESYSGWRLDLGDEGPAGAIYSSTNDMSTLGRAILNSTLLPAALTRRWMKPLTHTTSLVASVGAPWEIFSFDVQNRVIDLYTKSGDIGVYSSIIALSPDHNVGFTILAASAAGDPTALPLVIADVVATALIPALEQAAKEEAHSIYSGTYTTLTFGSEVSGLNPNSSIVITTDDGPGLKVEKWISNSTDMFRTLIPLCGASVASSSISVRLYPTGLRDRLSRKISFRAVIETSPSSPSEGWGIGPFTQSCFTWAEVDGLVYGNVGVDEFVFQLDETTAKAGSVSPRAMRMTLPRASTSPGSRR